MITQLKHRWLELYREAGWTESALPMTGQQAV